MKKILILILSVIVLSVSGCDKADVDDINTVAKVETEENSSVDVIEKISDAETETENKSEKYITEAVLETKAEAGIAPTTEVVKTSNKEEVQTEQAAETPTKEVQTERVTEPPTEENTSIKSYNPNEVVKLATAKTKKAGKTLLTDNLDNLLANGTITEEEYNEYYPYDGAGYYSVFVETNLEQASTTSGKRLESVDAIAQYIADMLACETGPYFLIEYSGTYSTGGIEFYEFRCYRA